MASALMTNVSMAAWRIMAAACQPLSSISGILNGYELSAASSAAMASAWRLGGIAHGTKAARRNVVSVASANGLISLASAKYQ